MKDLGYLVAAYVLAAAAIGGYLLSLLRRQRALERRLGQAPAQAEGGSHGLTGEGASRA